MEELRNWLAGAGMPGEVFWGDAAGHISYLIIAISYWLTNIYWLRVTAVIGLLLEVTYFVLVSGGTLCCARCSRAWTTRRSACC